LGKQKEMVVPAIVNMVLLLVGFLDRAALEKAGRQPRNDRDSQ
jgi:hypothetical protein